MPMMPSLGPGPVPPTGAERPCGADRLPPRRIEAIGIASSTGGPQVLRVIFERLRDARPCPIFVTQHMPSSFTALLAEQLGRAIGRTCREARDGEIVQTEGVYVAPGGFHMIVRQKRAGHVLCLAGSEPENYCRPAADPMLRSIAASYGAGSLALVLTGMGRDGLEGCRAIRQAGGGVIVQDEPSSVVWGMPGVVACHGLADAVLPPDAIARLLRAALAR